MAAAPESDMPRQFPRLVLAVVPVSVTHPGRGSGHRLAGGAGLGAA